MVRFSRRGRLEAGWCMRGTVTWIHRRGSSRRRIRLGWPVGLMPGGLWAEIRSTTRIRLDFVQILAIRRVDSASAGEGVFREACFQPSLELERQLLALVLLFSSSGTSTGTLL